LPGLLERKKDRYCYQLQIIASKRGLLQKVVGYLCQEMETQAVARRTRWSVDVDPLDMS